MQHYFVIFCLLFLSKSLVAQPYVRYQYYTNKAELAIVDSKYNSAIKYYDSAFHHTSSPFAIDLYNKMICHVKIDEGLKAFKIINLLVTKGVDSSIFQQRTVSSLRKNKKEYSKFIHNYPSLKKLYKKSINQEIVTKINEMITSDASFFCSSPIKPKNHYFINNLKNDAAFITNNLTALFDAYNGYLNEEVIGVYYTPLRGLSPFPQFYPLVFRAINSGDSIIIAQLETAYKNGQMKVEVFASLFENLFPGGFGNFNIVSVYQNRVYVTKGEHISLDTKKNREKYNMCTIEEQAKKNIFSRFVDKNGFIFITHINSYSTMSPLAEKHFIRTTILTKFYENIK